MKKNILIIIFIISAATGMAQNRLDKETSDRVIRSVQQLVNDSNYQKLGFTSIEDAKNVTVGTQLPVSIVPLDKLKTLDAANGTIESIKTRSASSFYQIIGGRSQQPAAFVNIEMKEGKAKIAGIGNATLAQSVTRISGRLNEEMRQSLELVRILALRLDFLAVKEGGNTVYIPLTSVPEFGIEQGSRLTDRSLVAIVLPVAQKYNGLPW